MKILIAINSLNPNISAIEYACYIANLSGAQLTGALLDNIEFSEMFPPSEPPIGPAAELRKEIKQQAENTIARFKQICSDKGTPCKVHRDMGIPYNELMHETRFADLLIIDAGMSFDDTEDQAPSHFVKKVLTHTECPVLIPPPSAAPVEEILFTYNGGHSSLFAMKHFTYLLPSLADKKITALEIAPRDGHITDKFRLQEWMQQHYKHTDYQLLAGDEENRLLEVALSKQNCIVVMGAYGRNTISKLFKHSHADAVLKISTNPVFISHN